MEESIWMGISLGPTRTRVIAMRGPNETILKAQLRATPSSTQAVQRFLEAIALWEGRSIRAALVVDDDPPTRAITGTVPPRPRRSALIARSSDSFWTGESFEVRPPHTQKSPRYSKSGKLSSLDQLVDARCAYP